MNKARSFYFSLAFLLLSNFSVGQNFHWESKLDPVTANGYYKILLGPEVTSQLLSGYPDVRIYDKDTLETPYLVYKDEARKGVDRFITYQIVEKKYENGSYIIVKNTIGNAIDHIILEVNNADAHRRMALSGSYDGKQWFAVKDEYSMVSFDNYDAGKIKTTNHIQFDFPQTDYRFYRFEFDDWKWWWHDYNLPIFIVRAGYTEPTYIPEECLEIPQPEMKQEEDKKTKQTILHLSFTDAQYIDHINFHIKIDEEKSEGFYRSASIYERIENKKDSLHPFEDRFISSTILSSMNPNEISLGDHKVKDLILKINNEDDRPLHIDSVNAYQVKHYLVAKLSSDNSYVLRYGSDSVNAPVYDMKYFADKILDANKKDIRTSGRKDIFMKPQMKTEKVAEEPFFKSRVFIWVAIGIVILLLAAISSRMLRDMKK